MSAAITANVFPVSSATLSRKPVSSYRPPPHRSLPPIPPRWAANDRDYAQPPLAQFVLLSLLLHILAILLFGAPSGGSREGRAMWGALNVVISSPFVEPVPMLKLDRGRLAPMLAPPKRSEPAPRKVETVAPAPVVPDAAPAATVANPVPPKPEPVSIPPLLDRLIAPDRRLEMAPAFRVPPPRERPAAPQPQAAPPPVVAPLPPPPAPAPRVERIPTEAPPVAAPLVQPVPLPPPVERAPVETPALPALTPTTPPVERPPLELPALPVPESVAPARVEPAPKPVEKAPAPEVAPTPAPVPAAPTALERAIERAQEQEREQAPKVAPLPGPLPRERETTPGSAPRQQEKIPGDYDPTKPSLDLDAIRNRAGQMAREGSGRRALLPFPMPPVAKPKSKLETAIEKARKPDCKDAYKDLGLAAIVPLIANEFGEGSCRW